MCGNPHILRYLSVYSKYWRSILALYSEVYGRILGSIRPYTRSIRRLSTFHPCHHSHQLPPPLQVLMTLQPQNNPACAQCCIISIVRANFQKYDLYSTPIARALPRSIVPFFKFFKTGKSFKTILFPVSCVSQKPLPFQKHSLLLIQPKTHAKTLSERSEKCATVQVLTDENSVARATYLQRALGALWRALYQV